MKKSLSFILEIAKIVVVALAIVIPIRYFLFQPFFVKGESMQPNFENGDYLIIDEISYRLRDPQRGEVIVFKYPQNESQLFIKRIIGLPGEKIEIIDNMIKVTKKDGQLLDLKETSYLSSSIQTAGNMNITLEDNQYFVLGDNRQFSYDSRRFGVVSKNEIIGKVFLRAWPFSSLGIFRAPSYAN
ncbi:MAG: signal peptidase I [Candidatus Nealsonbacteria bacterium]|nr:signal peptidase I [Candidatus Nealsonbacteria bacterium]